MQVHLRDRFGTVNCLHSYDSTNVLKKYKIENIESIVNKYIVQCFFPCEYYENNVFVM